MNGPLGIGIAVAIALSACSDDGGSNSSSSRCGLEGGGRCRPNAERVDLARPSFADPTDITNRLFPTSTLTQFIQLGEEGGEAARNEITRLPGTKTIEWNGQRIETVVRQFVAYADGRVVEVALDFFAQADDGSVWYFGEDVFNYEDGVVADTEGTWLAGKDGPAGMIMPARPTIGDVYRPENIPGLVFEEVTVKSTSETVDGPQGRIEGAVEIEEHLMEGTFETKFFAPRYGEFRIETDGELVTLALGVPIDELPTPPPAELEALVTGAAETFAAARSGDWAAASTAVGTMTTAWAALRPDGLPKVLEAQMGVALDAVTAAVALSKPAEAQHAANDVTQAALDLRLRHRPVAEIDLARLDLWARQLLVDADAGDRAGVLSDVAILETIRDRVDHTLDADAVERVNAHLSELRGAADDGNVRAAGDAVPALRATLATL